MIEKFSSRKVKRLKRTEKKERSKESFKATSEKFPISDVYSLRSRSKSQVLTSMQKLLLFNSLFVPI
jgi:hypothetical protein